MKRAIMGTLILALVPCLAQAQSDDYPKWHGYGYVAPGGRVTSGSGSRVTVHFGGGGERFFNRNAGMGAEVGYLRPVGGGCCNKGWGTLSPNFVARFPRKDVKKVEPFVTAGYTRVNWVPGDDNDGFNFGAGFNWWARKRIALRIEVRDHVFFEGATDHLLGLRIGVTFRSKARPAEPR